MPFIPNTPESNIARSDSKNPATTCKGITLSGRPCRNPLSSPQKSPNANRNSHHGVVAVLEAQDDEHDGAAAFFCWHHQDQARKLQTESENGRKVEVVPLKSRTSIDTLAERLGVLDVQEAESPTKGKQKQKQKRQHPRPVRKETLPSNWQDMDGPLLGVSNKKQRRRRTESRKHENKLKGQSNLALFCCIGQADRDATPPPRVRKDPPKKQDTSHQTLAVPLLQQPPSTPFPSRPSEPQPSPSGHSPFQPSPTRPGPSQPTPSTTQAFLSHIPSDLNPTTTSLLLAELAKPLSPHDEAGYIYLFWLTKAPFTKLPPPYNYHIAARMTPLVTGGTLRYVTPGAKPRSEIPSHVMFKIGRASNVQRRLNEWTRQCGDNLECLRYWPHRPSSSSTQTPEKVPYAHRVERLIHIELAEQRVKRKCDSCGKEHREWFQVENTKEGLYQMNEVIKRWVNWGISLT